MALNFEGLVEVLKRNREQPTIEEELLSQNLCPYDEWVLKTNQKTGERACPICGRTFK